MYYDAWARMARAFISAISVSLFVIWVRPHNHRMLVFRKLEKSSNDTNYFDSGEPTVGGCTWAQEPCVRATNLDSATSRLPGQILCTNKSSTTGKERSWYCDTEERCISNVNSIQTSQCAPWADNPFRDAGDNWRQVKNATLTRPAAIGGALTRTTDSKPTDETATPTYTTGKAAQQVTKVAGSSSDNGGGTGRLGTGAVAGAVIGGLVGLGLIVVGIVWASRRYIDKKVAEALQQQRPSGHNEVNWYSGVGEPRELRAQRTGGGHESTHIPGVELQADDVH
ncbi:hypothetical protein K440DRAFT_664132 [Wilcoxina mikolae CBS 423.85]|nr:hypothetical protein K440DRAFT_664132 [Wilcoxina mikolae CBS 423.85]